MSSATDLQKPVFSARSAAWTIVCVLVVSVCLAWMYLVMRSVMGVGGSCADGGPYVSAQPCPGGSWLISIAAPVMIIGSMIGTATASSVGAPNLLLPMWGVLFGSLGWNFLEFAFKGPDVVAGWVVCGVMFWAMAAPAFWLMLVGLRVAVNKRAETKAFLWIPAYGFLGALGLLLGWWSFVSVAS